MQIVSLFRTAVWNGDERRPRAPWRLLVAALLLAIGLLAVNVAFLIVGVDLESLGTVPAMAVATVVMLLVTVVALWMVARYVDRRQFTDYGLRIDHRWWTDFAFGLALGGLLQTAIVLVGWVAGWYQVTGLLVAEGSLVVAIGSALVLFLAIGVLEELLTRGWLLTNLAEGLRFLGTGAGVAAAVVLSSVVFGALHLGNPGASLRSAAIISLAGVFLALGYVLTGELGIPIGIHVTWNFFQGSIYGLGVSGLEMSASVIAVEPVGPEYVTGGGFGPEAGVLGIGAIVLGSAAIAWWVQWREGTVQIHEVVSTPRRRDQFQGDPLDPGW